MPNFASIAKAGVAGCCSIYLLIFGAMLIPPGIVLIQMGQSDSYHNEVFDDPFFKHSNEIFEDFDR